MLQLQPLVPLYHYHYNYKLQDRDKAVNVEGDRDSTDADFSHPDVKTSCPCWLPGNLLSLIDYYKALSCKRVCIVDQTIDSGSGVSVIAWVVYGCTDLHHHCWKEHSTLHATIDYNGYQECNVHCHPFVYSGKRPGVIGDLSRPSSSLTSSCHPCPWP